jgi:hypothetical protein
MKDAVEVKEIARACTGGLVTALGLAISATSSPAHAQAAGLTLCNHTSDRIYDLFIDNPRQRATPLGLSGIEPGACATAHDLAPDTYDLHFASDRGGLCVLKIAVTGAAKIDIGLVTDSCIM